MNYWDMSRDERKVEALKDKDLLLTFSLDVWELCEDVKVSM